MSVVCECDEGWVLSHLEFLENVYGRLGTFYRTLFRIRTQFLRDDQARSAHSRLTEGKGVEVDTKSQKRKKNAGGSGSNVSEEAMAVRQRFESIMKEVRESGKFSGTPTPEEILQNNKTARETVEQYYSVLEEVELTGANTKSSTEVLSVEGKDYLVPAGSTYFSNKVEDVMDKLCGSKFDFVVIDPPWWNKFVRRKKLKSSKKGYDMMYNSEVSRLAVDKLLEENGLVALWTTNNPSHIEHVRHHLFPCWGVQYVATWYWVKVTSYGEAVNAFSSANGKQPYERIMFGCKPGRSIPNPQDNKCIVSVPSALHSHKPPLSEVLQKHLQQKPKCLELFARYLLPNWTSCGDQVLSLQLKSFFEDEDGEGEGGEEDNKESESSK